MAPAGLVGEAMGGVLKDEDRNYSLGGKGVTGF